MSAASSATGRSLVPAQATTIGAVAALRGHAARDGDAGIGVVLEGRAALHELAGPLELLGGQARDEHVALACGDERVHDAGDLLGRFALAVDDLARAASGASREVELRIADVCHFGRDG